MQQVMFYCLADQSYRQVSFGLQQAMQLVNQKELTEVSEGFVGKFLWMALDCLKSLILCFFGM